MEAMPTRTTEHDSESTWIRRQSKNDLIQLLMSIEEFLLSYDENWYKRLLS